MAQIALKNFRKFETLDSLKLNDINIFVGKNNAGKSTVVKALMLVLDNIRSLRWANISNIDGMQTLKNAPVPYFRFDSNGFHNLHIGTFERAKCNYSENNRITFELEYDGIVFEITIAGIEGQSQVIVPIEVLRLSFPGECSYILDFSNMQMKFILEKSDDQSLPTDTLKFELNKLYTELNKLDVELENAVKSSDALRAANLQGMRAKVLKAISVNDNKLHHEEKNRKGDAYNHEATFDLSFFHDHLARNILIQYLITFKNLASSNVYQTTQIGSMLGATDNHKKNGKEQKEQYSKREIINDNVSLINSTINKLEILLDSINVDYIQAHAATQKLILSADDKDKDVNSKVVYDFFQENILPGQRADIFLNKWMKEFEIGNGINIEQLDGEGYYVKIHTSDGIVHLADMGMGSIQLTFLLLRLATIANRIHSARNKWWVVIEEPEQNIHPVLQSKLADLFKDFQKEFEATIIVETHSEYLIRRTQLQVSEAQYTQEDIINSWSITVFYFPSEHGLQPYDMQYLPSGLFARKFGKGFFDEAGRMHMEILKRSKN